MLVLKDTSELAEDAVSKNPIIFKVCLEKIFEFLLGHRILGLETMLLLVPLLNYCLVEKQEGKKDLIWLIGPTGFEIILTLLVETIVI